MDSTIKRIMNSYMRFFKVKDLNVQIVLTDDMYETQKKYGFNDEEVKSLDEATARKNWKHVAACMKYPKHMDEPFALLFKRSYFMQSPIYEKYRLVFHELTHLCDYRDYARLNDLHSFKELFGNPETVLFQHWSEYHAERRGYAAWLKYRYGVRMTIPDFTKERIRIMKKETVNTIQYYGEHYTNTAEYGSTRQIYFTMHMLARMSCWHQMLPKQVDEILNRDPFNYRGILWIKKLMKLFEDMHDIEHMNAHFYDIAFIISENLALTKEQMWERI